MALVAPLRHATPRTRLVLAVVAASTVLTGVYGFAATLGAGTNSLAAGDRLVASCGPGMTFAYTTGFESGSAGYAVNGIDLSNIPSGCLGKSLSLTLTNSRNQAVGSPVNVTLPASGTVDRIPIDPGSNLIDAAEVSGVSVAVS